MSEWPHNRFQSGVLVDWQIACLCPPSCEDHCPHVGGCPFSMIAPFEPKPVRMKGSTPGDPAGTEARVVSYGLGHYGYDMRVANEFKVFTNINATIVDPKAPMDASFVEVKGDCVIPPNSFALARSIEKFHIPRHVLALVIGKSTYARCGIIVNCTPLEPEWEGHVTLEISNTTPLPARIYGNEGIAQVIFFWASDTCKTSYADKGGKYQSQGPEITLPRM